ncbi:MAG: hypothetical protein PW734_05085 [Verrucomicrobium sp.]|nr:hypothetical protein [Verrucomicrobium sp.]
MSSAPIPLEVWIVRDYDKTIGPDTTDSFTKFLGREPAKELYPSYVENGKKGYGVGVSFCKTVTDFSNRLEAPITRTLLEAYGPQHPEYPGAAEFVLRKKAELEAAYPGTVHVRNAIASTGIRELLAQTPSGRVADAIYASQFNFNDEGVVPPDPSKPQDALVGFRKPLEPLQKVEVLAAIERGVMPHALAQNPFAASPTGANDFVAARAEGQHAKRKVLLITFGDGNTDDWAAQETLLKGGKFIAVHEPGSEPAKKKAETLRAAGLTETVVPADYRQGSELDQAFDAIVHQAIAAIEAPARSAEKAQTLSIFAEGGVQRLSLDGGKDADRSPDRTK